MLIKMLFPTSFYNSCIIWEAAIEIFSCKAVNHSQSADVMLSWDSGIVIYICPLCPPSGITPLPSWLSAGGNGGSTANVICEYWFCEMQ